MHVLFDISVLGSGFYFPENRAGIFRSVENLAVHLYNNRECDLSFSAVQSYVKFLLALKYVENRRDLENVLISYPKHKVYKMTMRMANAVLPTPQMVAFPSFLKVCDAISEHGCGALTPEKASTSDIFHSPFYPLPAYLKKMPRLKKFLTVYDLIPVLYPDFFNRGILRVFRKILRSIDRDTWILAISHCTKNDLCSHLGLDPSMIIVTHLAASTNFYPCRDQKQISAIQAKHNIPPEPFILSVSTLEPRKNIDHVVRSFGRLVQEQNIRDLNLVLVGSKGWNFEKIFHSMSGLSSLKDRIIVTGHVDDADLAKLYSGATMFVYPSFYEGFGLPPLEAMQCGVPVVTSNTSSLPEVVGDAGIMVDPSDQDALCQAMLEIYRNPNLRSELSAKSIERAKLFSWDNCARKTVEGYKTALES